MNDIRDDSRHDAERPDAAAQCTCEPRTTSHLVSDHQRDCAYVTACEYALEQHPIMPHHMRRRHDAERQEGANARASNAELAVLRACRKVNRPEGQGERIIGFRVPEEFAGLSEGLFILDRLLDRAAAAPSAPLAPSVEEIRRVLEPWVTAEQARLDASRAYNDRHEQVQRERAGGDWSGSLDWYYQQVNETQKASIKAAQEMFEPARALLSRLQAPTTAGEADDVDVPRTTCPQCGVTACAFVCDRPDCHWLRQALAPAQSDVERALRLVASERGVIDCDDERLDEFSNNGDPDTLNVCFQRRLLRQRYDTSSDSGTIEITPDGIAAIAAMPSSPAPLDPRIVKTPYGDGYRLSDLDENLEPLPLPATAQANVERVESSWERDKWPIEERVRHLELYGTANVDSWLDIILKRLDEIEGRLPPVAAIPSGPPRLDPAAVERAAAEADNVAAVFRAHVKKLADREHWKAGAHASTTHASALRRKGMSAPAGLDPATVERCIEVAEAWVNRARSDTDCYTINGALEYGRRQFAEGILADLRALQQAKE